MLFYGYDVPITLPVTNVFFCKGCFPSPETSGGAILLSQKESLTVERVSVSENNTMM